MHNNLLLMTSRYSLTRTPIVLSIGLQEGLMWIVLAQWIPPPLSTSPDLPRNNFSHPPPSFHRWMSNGGQCPQYLWIKSRGCVGIEGANQFTRTIIPHKSTHIFFFVPDLASLYDFHTVEWAHGIEKFDLVGDGVQDLLALLLKPFTLHLSSHPTDFAIPLY